MQITNEQLNQASTMLKTNDKAFILLACVKTLIDSGVEVKTAFDSVIGAGAYETIANQVHAAS